MSAVRGGFMNAGAGGAVSTGRGGSVGRGGQRGLVTARWQLKVVALGVIVLDHHQSRAGLDDRDLAAEPAEHLPELQPDVAPAEDDQVLRERAQLHDRR